ncbi:hypothetical protein RSF45_004927, partial [Yersinia enterocolitica]|nr:hypothetical protein [Yersinia enterocolitica]
MSLSSKPLNPHVFDLPVNLIDFIGNAIRTARTPLNDTISKLAGQANADVITMGGTAFCFIKPTDKVAILSGNNARGKTQFCFKVAGLIVQFPH